jgi:soluble lytic murein transglycosylase-like protein
MGAMAATVERLLEHGPGARLLLLAPTELKVGQTPESLVAALQAAGHVRVRIDGKTMRLDEKPALDRKRITVDALQARDYAAAYGASANTGATIGPDAAEAEFYAGWIALSKLRNPKAAAGHFAKLAAAGTSPITQGRALYWQGRAAEALGDQAGALAFYQRGGQHITTFYGQLAAEKAGLTTINLPADPVPTSSDVAAFEGHEVVRALRILGETGEMSLFRVFAFQLDDDLPGPAGLALLMDLSRNYGEGFTAMMVGRAASQRGFLMPERQYPVRLPPSVAGAAPLEFTLAITRQESSFDPRARSAADARGMMQFLPSTAAGMGVDPYDPRSAIDGAARYLRAGFDRFGSWDMAVAAYNIGPNAMARQGSILPGSQASKYLSSVLAAAGSVA